MQQFDVVTIGDSVLDTFLSLHSASAFARFDTDTDELRIRSGGKVLLEDAQFLLGGNATNVAVGLQRLGLTTALIAELGDDEFAAKITKTIQKEGVSLDFIKIAQGAPSTFSVILDVLGDRTAFIRHVTRDHAIPLEGFETKWIYLTSMGKEWRAMYQDVLTYKKSHGTKLAFNPGSAQMQEGPDSFADVLAQTDILFVNRDEAEIILHGKTLTKEERETEENLLFRIQRAGPKMIVMTDGDNGSYVMDEKANLLYEKAAACKIVEKTGAGDAYASGFLSAIFLGKSTKEAMQFGAENAASVIEHVGAQAGLLTKEAMEKRMTQGTPAITKIT